MSFFLDAGDVADGKGESSKGGGGTNSLYLVSHEDFCVYGPSEANTPINSVGDNVVSWCTKVRLHLLSSDQR